MIDGEDATEITAPAPLRTAEVAAYLGAADADEVAFTSGCTLALNIAANGLAERLREDDEILISWLEHHSNIVPWQMAAARRGARVRAIPVTEDGRLDLDRLDEVLTPRTRIIAVTHASNVTGAISDVARLREAADAVGASAVTASPRRCASRA